MQRFSKTIAAIMLMVSTLVFTGCIKEEEDIVEPSQEVNVNPAYVPIDWEITTVASSNDSAGTYQIQFSGTVPDIHPGSIIAIDRDTVVLYRFVTSANVSGNTLSVTSAEADLTDIFHDCDFTLTTESSSNTKGKGVVFRPVAAYSIDDDGNYRAINLKNKGNTRFTHNLWHYGFNNDGYVIDEGTYHRIQMDRMNMDVDIDFEMYMNFGGATARQLAGEAFIRYISDAMQVNAALIGTFNTEQQIRFIVWGGCDVTTPTITLIKNVFPAKTIKFMAGPVPIVLKLQSDLCGKASVGGGGQIQAYSGFTDHATGRVGFEWNQSTGIRGVSKFENVFSYIPPTVEGQGEIHRKAWVFPRISLMLIGVVGPGFDIMPYEADTVRGGFREQMLGQTNDYCAYQFDMSTGLDLCCELNLGIFKRWQLLNDITGGVVPSTPIWNVFNKRLYHSPLKVRHASGRPQNGGQDTVYFDVYDTILLTHTSAKTILPQIVKFEANGQLSSEYGIAVPGTGRVSVNWTPTSNDILYAKLYDQDGNVIAWDTVKVEACDCDITDGNWVDLGLPSGLLWASRNVGANAPEAFGDYFAWGETSPKSSYDLSNYLYYSYSNYWSGYTKYCNVANWACDFITDTLTILQPGDDAATANLGDVARTPTKEEWEELVQNTTHSWIHCNGVRGLHLRGPNGNAIFLPYAGYVDGIYLEDAIENVDELENPHGYYWSSSLKTNSPSSAWYMSPQFGSTTCYHDYRHYGLTIRAVRSGGKK